MNLGFIDRPTVMHEFGHALGLIHEHQSPFKGMFEWNKDEVCDVVVGADSQRGGKISMDDSFKHWNWTYFNLKSPRQIQMLPHFVALQCSHFPSRYSELPLIRTPKMRPPPALYVFRTL